MKSSLLIVLISAGLFAHADWTEDNLVFEVDSTDPKEMATALTLFPDAMTWLNAQNLTAPSRLVVQRFAGKIANYRWENDDQCTVADPTLVPLRRMSDAHADFYFEAKPVDIWHVDVVSGAGTPCDGSKPELRISAR